jgi:protein-tyrosine phosphatase
VSTTLTPIRILFVCLGNICRSPLAEGVFRHKLAASGLESRFDVASAGTGHWHVGHPPDSRMAETALAKGVDIRSQRARQFVHEDLGRFEHIFVMDKNNLEDVLALDRTGDFSGRVRLFREFDPEPGDYQVPDPYYGGAQGFENVFAIVDRTVDVLLRRLWEEYGETEGRADGKPEGRTEG